MGVNRKAANKQERRITRSLSEIERDARQQMASGSIWFAKSDVITDRFQIEAKTRVKPQKTMVIHKNWFDKIQTEARQNSKTPLLAFSFGDGVDYYALRDKDLYELVLRLNELEALVGEGEDG